MTSPHSTLPAPSSDRLSDRAVWWFVMAMIGISFLIESRSGHMELVRAGVTDPAAFTKEWLYELTSHIALIVAALIVPRWLNIFPLSISSSWRRVPAYFLGFILFVLIHVGLMVALRKLAWPFISDGQYVFGLTAWEPWIYEAQKDAFSFISLVGTFLAARHMRYLRGEAQAVRAEAKRTGQLSLKSGGRLITLPAADLVYAAAAGNYVELYTETGQHFVRLTLTELETLLNEAGAQPVRLHRSYLTLHSRLRQIDPAQVSLAGGETLPLGRTYRARLGALG